MATKEEEMDEHTASLGVLAAIPWWIKSKRDSGADPVPNPKLTELMHLLFRTLDAMYLETRRLPFYARSGATGRPKENPDSFIFALWLKNRDYIALRSILALSGDLIYVLEKLMTLPGLLELGPLLPPLYNGQINLETLETSLLIWMMPSEITQDMEYPDLQLWTAAKNSNPKP